jgi:hypothetical protein
VNPPLPNPPATIFAPGDSDRGERRK